jgi:hypothetical protein
MKEADELTTDGRLAGPIAGAASPRQGEHDRDEPDVPADPETDDDTPEHDPGDNLITNPLDKPGASDPLITNPLDKPGAPDPLITNPLDR